MKAPPVAGEMIVGHNSSPVSLSLTPGSHKVTPEPLLLDPSLHEGGRLYTKFKEPVKLSLRNRETLSLRCVAVTTSLVAAQLLICLLVNVRGSSWKLGASSSSSVIRASLRSHSPISFHSRYLWSVWCHAPSADVSRLLFELV